MDPGARPRVPGAVVSIGPSAWIDSSQRLPVLAQPLEVLLGRADDREARLAEPLHVGWAAEQHESLPKAVFRGIGVSSSTPAKLGALRDALREAVERLEQLGRGPIARRRVERRGPQGVAHADGDRLDLVRHVLELVAPGVVPELGDRGRPLRARLREAGLFPSVTW